MHRHERRLQSGRNIGVALSITVSFFIVELVGGFVTNSLALVADAWHMLNDAFALGFAVVAAWIAERYNFTGSCNGVSLLMTTLLHTKFCSIAIC